MADSPNSYKDQYWSQLASATESKLGLPDGLLVNIVTKGERSNADQVSEAGARSPFQIIPATRKAAIDKYGIDPYLSPENAAEVAGNLLKDSLDRNKGNQVLAVAEYHGGTNRDNWGPRTKAYVKRVVGMSPDNPAATTAAPAPAKQSTFDRVSQQVGLNAVPESAIANIYKAYQGGQMSPEESKAFEDDVNAGRVMLPRGATLNNTTTSAQPSSAAMVLPAAVIDAYASGQMGPDDKQQLERDLSAGLVSLPAGAKLGQSSAVFAIPLPDGAAERMAAEPPKPADPGLVDKLIGTGEAGLTALTGATGGAVGLAGGTIKGLAGSVMDGTFGTEQGVRNVEQAAAEGANALTYQPRTESGRQQAQAVGEVFQQALPVMPMTGELAAMGAAAKPVTQAARDVTASGVARIKAASPAIAERVQRIIDRNPEPAAPTPGTMASGGSAGTDMATQRAQAAESLPVPIKLTEGQATRDPNKLRFELETSKGAEGGKFRDRYSDQNELIQRNFDTWVDQIGKTTADETETGKVVNQVLRKELARDKAQVRVEYNAAEKAGEMESPVALNGLIEHLNESAPDAATAPLLNVARGRAIQLGIAAEDANGNLVALPTTLKNAERMRQAVGRATDYEATNVRQSAIIKGLIDAETDGLGGNLYRTARRARENFAKKWENRAIVSDLVNNKRGMDDRKVAIEDIFKHSVLDSDRAELGHIRRVLQTGGEEGQQAWRELQGQTVEWIKNEAFSNTATDQRGNVILSVAKLEKAIEKLEKGGKLDFIFGKRGAEQMRDLNDLAKVIYTAPPGVVNTSNTASVLLAAMTEAGINGSMTGLPVPVISALRLATMQVKNHRIQKRIEQALNYRPPNHPPVAPAPPRTLH